MTTTNKQKLERLINKLNKVNKDILKLQYKQVDLIERINKLKRENDGSI